MVIPFRNWSTSIRFFSLGDTFLLIREWIDGQCGNGLELEITVPHNLVLQGDSSALFYYY